MNTSQKVPADYQDQQKHFCRAIVRYRELHTYRMNGICITDQTMFKNVFDTSRFDSAPSSTNSIRDLHSIRIATTEKGFTVALCALADGTKLPAMVMFKEKDGELGPGLTIPTNFVVAASTKWMDDQLSSP